MKPKDNPFYKRAERQAKKMADNPKKMRETLDKAMKKSKILDDTKDKAKSLKDDLFILFDMMKSYLSGSYKALPWKTFVKIGAGILYFLWFADLIPDFLIGIGLIDDAAVIAWILKSIKVDLDQFKVWKAGKNEQDSVLNTLEE